MKDAINAYYPKIIIEDVYISRLNLKSTDLFIRNFTQYYIFKLIKYDYDLPSLIFFKSLLDVNDQAEFKENFKRLNDKSKQGLNMTKLELDIYQGDSSLTCTVTSEITIYQNSNVSEDIYDGLRCDKNHDILQILSPFGKCFTFLYEFNENEKNVSLVFGQYLYQIHDLLHEYYYRNKFNAITYRLLIHSRDSLPVLTNDELFFTDTTVTKSIGFFIKLTKYEFKRLPKPYDTNCQNYGNNNRYKCVNNCYFELYMDSIECIPNFDSLYTFKLNDRKNERNITFCSEENEPKNNSLNEKLKNDCNNECQLPCIDTYLTSDYDEVHFSNNVGGGINYRVYLKDAYYRKINYSPKMTFFSLIIDSANIWSLWHGITFLSILELFVVFLYRKLSGFRFTKIIITKFKKIEKIIERLIENLNLKVN